MAENNYIVDQPLPQSEDFQWLKAEGLSFIQSIAGNNWSNLNPSDPGVTILEQVCYALTELGYCGNFPIEDILTDAKGNLSIKDQFYLPEDILTTSPIAVDDYRKYLIDGVKGVSNATLVPATLYGVEMPGVYQVYILPEKDVVDGVNLCNAAFYYLNKSRNICELFLMPKILIPIKYEITAQLEISQMSEMANIFGEIENALDNYVFPSVPALGAKQLFEKGYATNDVFDGPLLLNGFVTTDSLGKKRDKIFDFEIFDLIKSIPGVISLTGFSIKGSQNPIVVDENELIKFCLKTSVSNPSLTVKANGLLLPDKYLKSTVKSIDIGAKELDDSLVYDSLQPNSKTELPLGKYREINSYYSIQNTFPEIYGVGADSVVANATDYQIAQSRQLKGYLTLFDQVMANEFSQLANLGNLFSFNNCITGTPSDKKTFYDVKDKFEQEHLEYPVPYLSFAPTYFYQSLYEVPHIRPLLKNNNTFDFSVEPESAKILEEQSWSDYKFDPYNPYIHGLKELTENETNDLTRRNEMLDHLLARFGESPLIIDVIITKSIYSGNSLRDKVIFKSLYLQNLGLISYNRQKAYNIIGANKLDDLCSTEFGDKMVKYFTEFGHYSVFRDGIFDSASTDHLEKLYESDFVNYSAIELKLSLLFGLGTIYREFIFCNIEESVLGLNSTSDIITKLTLKLKVALWLQLERKGFLLIEGGSAFDLVDVRNGVCKVNSLEYQSHIILIRDIKNECFLVVNDILENSVAKDIREFIGSCNDIDLNFICSSGLIVMGANIYSLSIIYGDFQQYFPDINLIKGHADSNYELYSKKEYIGKILRLGIFRPCVTMVFPDFIPAFVAEDFTHRLKVFMQTMLPPHVQYRPYPATGGQLKNIIPAFVKKRNSLIYKENLE